MDLLHAIQGLMSIRIFRIVILVLRSLDELICMDKGTNSKYKGTMPFGIHSMLRMCSGLINSKQFPDFVRIHCSLTMTFQLIYYKLLFKSQSHHQSNAITQLSSFSLDYLLNLFFISRKYIYCFQLNNILMSLSQLLLLEDSQHFRPLHPLTKFTTVKPQRRMSLSLKRFQVNREPQIRPQRPMLLLYKGQLQCHSKDNQQYKRYKKNEFIYLIKKTKQLIEPEKRKKINLNNDQKAQFKDNTDRKKSISFRSKEFHQSNSNYWRTFLQCNPEMQSNTGKDGVANEFQWSERTCSYFNRAIHHTLNRQDKKQKVAGQQQGNQLITQNISQSVSDKKWRNSSQTQSRRDHYVNRGRNISNHKNKFEMIRPNTTELNYRPRTKNTQINQSCEMLEPW